jgi:hypothetical protein
VLGVSIDVLLYFHGFKAFHGNLIVPSLALGLNGSESTKATYWPIVSAPDDG